MAKTQSAISGQQRGFSFNTNLLPTADSRQSPTAIIGFRFKFKILFHKNKEIKRMLSKKMAFSLSIITIFALAFVAPSAMAAFDVTITADDVVEGDAIEIEYSTRQVIKISFGEVIKPGDFTYADISVLTIAGNGLPSVVSFTAADAVPVGTPNNGKNFMVTLPAAAGQVGYDADDDAAGTLATKIFVQIAKEVVEKFDDSTNKNNAASKEILLVREEPGTLSLIHISEPTRPY